MTTTEIVVSCPGCTATATVTSLRDATARLDHDPGCPVTARASSSPRAATGQG